MVTHNDKYKELGELLRSGLEGDNASYAKFLSLITPLLRRMIRTKISGPDAEDVVQEVLISIHKARHTYDDKRPVMPWLLSIARFRLTDHLRKYYAQMRHQTVDIADFENSLADVTQGYSGHESIEELLEHVKPKDQRILTMMHIEGYTAKEIGAQLRMNESAVKVAAHRAIKKIRDTFGI